MKIIKVTTYLHTKVKIKFKNTFYKQSLDAYYGVLSIKKYALCTSQLLSLL